MKHKLAKRSLSNKHAPSRSLQTQTRRLSISHDYHRPPSPSKANSDIVPSDSQKLCLKPNVPLKSQKLLKRDLLRCSNQRPSLLGLQTLQPPRIQHGSQPHPSVVLSALNHTNAKCHSSLADHPQMSQATIDRIGPWPDISINYIRLEGNDLQQPLKTLRNTKNPRLFSPKYYSTLSEHHTKFKFHPAKRSYAEDYRKQKGYLLSSRLAPQPTSLSSSSLGRLQHSEDDQLSVYGANSMGTGSHSARDQTDLSSTQLSLRSRKLSKSVDDLVEHNNSSRSPSNPHLLNPFSRLPTIRIQNNQQLQIVRPTHQQTVTLPAITSRSFQYLNSINAMETPFDGQKKMSMQNQSKLYFIDERQQKRLRPVHKITLDFELPAAR